MTVTERFLKYVSYDTTSDPMSRESPSSSKQLILSREIEKDMKELGLKDVYIDSCGNVIGTVPKNGVDSSPIALIAHLDTSYDAPGADIKPRTVEYNGGDIILSPGKVLSPKDFPELSGLCGRHLIVTDGTTLLGADDKAGIAEIFETARMLLESHEPHCELRLIVTTDEEVGTGVDGLDVEKLNCEYAYTVDGGPIGEIEYENFNASAVTVTFEGLGIHPGTAKDKMVNAAAMAAFFHSMMPADAVPEKTEKYEGFIHLCSMSGDVNSAVMRYIIRDHSKELFEEKKRIMLNAAAETEKRFGESRVKVTMEDTYYNMREKIEPHMHLIERAKAAFVKNGVEPRIIAVRGGTDGARLSYMGLPCPNLCAGGYNYHGVYEFIPVESLEKIPQILFDLVLSFNKR